MITKRKKETYSPQFLMVVYTVLNTIMHQEISSYPSEFSDDLFLTN